MWSYFSPAGTTVPALIAGYSQEVARAAIGMASDGRPLAPEARIVLAVGRIEPLKGLDILIRGLAEMTERERARLLIVGGDDRADGGFGGEIHLTDEVGCALLLPGDGGPAWRGVANDRSGLAGGGAGDREEPDSNRWIGPGRCFGRLIGHGRNRNFRV